MPCNGISVAAARVPTEVETYLALLPQGVIDQAVKNLLTNMGFQVTGDTGSFQLTPKATAGKQLLQGLGIGSNRGYSVEVSGERITVYGPDYQVKQDIREKISALLSVLAGKVRQGEIIKKLAQAGVKVQGQQVASNGSVVLSVEL